MACHSSDNYSPTALDIRDPNFAAKCLHWRHQQQCEIVELIARTRETLTVSRALMLDVDRLLTWRPAGAAALAVRPG
jgi:hypothetical protein